MCVFEKASLNDLFINTPSYKRSVHVWLRFLQRRHVVYPSNNLPSVLFNKGRTYRTDEGHFLDSKDGDTLLLWIMGNHLITNMASYPRRLQSTLTSLREFRITYLLTYSLSIDTHITSQPLLRRTAGWLVYNDMAGSGRVLTWETVAAFSCRRRKKPQETLAKLRRLPDRLESGNSRIKAWSPDAWDNQLGAKGLTNFNSTEHQRRIKSVWCVSREDALSLLGLCYQLKGSHCLVRSDLQRLSSIYFATCDVQRWIRFHTGEICARKNSSKWITMTYWIDDYIRILCVYVCVYIYIYIYIYIHVGNGTRYRN